MARADRRRSQRARPPAVVRRQEAVIEDTMFFPRLRRHAKWMFLFLALVFGLGFVGFGVGAGGIGVGNIFEGRSQAGVPSVGEAEERVSDNPRDPQAFRDLATAHEAVGNTDEAIEAYENLVALRPKNADALQGVARLYLLKVEEAQIRAQQADLRATYIAPGASVAGTIVIGGKPLEPDTISSAVNGQLSEAVSTALGEAQQAAAQAVDAYKRRAAAAPRNPDYQLELAQTAEFVGDSATAIEAYEKFIAIDKTNPLVPEIRQQLKKLRAQSGATG
jgi:tetratricopeptide (TPR) repeat protein